MPAMATSFRNANWLLSPNCCSSQSIVKAVPSRTICVGCGVLVSPPCPVSSALCVSQDHSKLSSLRYGHFSLVGAGPGDGMRHGSSRRPSRRTWKQSRGGGIATASSTVDETALDEVKVKIKVGPVRSRSERVYVFQKIFASSSIVVVTLPKPLGIVFVESPLKNAYGKNRVMVGELVTGGNADRASRVAQLFLGAPRNNAQSNIPIINGGILPGDILRATTTAGVYVDFFGIRRPQRVMDLYVADGRPWHLIMRALNASFFADGELTLVFERRNSNF